MQRYDDRLILHKVQSVQNLLWAMRRRFTVAMEEAQADHPDPEDSREVARGVVKDLEYVDEKMQGLEAQLRLAHEEVLGALQPDRPEPASEASLSVTLQHEAIKAHAEALAGHAEPSGTCVELASEAAKAQTATRPVVEEAQLRSVFQQVLHEELGTVGTGEVPATLQLKLQEALKCAVAQAVGDALPKALGDQLKERPPHESGTRLEETLAATLPDALEATLSGPLGDELEKLQMKLPYALEYALEEALQSKLPDVLEEKLSDALEEKLEEALSDALEDKLQEALSDAMEDKLEEALSDALEDKLEEALSDALEDTLPPRLLSALRDTLDEKMPDAVVSQVEDVQTLQPLAVLGDDSLDKIKAEFDWPAATGRGAHIGEGSATCVKYRFSRQQAGCKTFTQHRCRQ